MKLNARNQLRVALANESVRDDLVAAFPQVVGQVSAVIANQTIAANTQFETGDLPLTLRDEQSLPDATTGYVWGMSALPEAGLVVRVFTNPATGAARIRLCNFTLASVNWVSKTVTATALRFSTT